ncbi:MAG: hypothetical protein NZ807_10790 [Dehalococcoidia bacterium]|nr:hypothetical protein [Dehalococcoidia bacterium]
MSLIIVIMLLGMSCSSQPASSDTPTGAYDSCKGFADSNMIEDLTGTVGLVERTQILDIDSIPGLTESGAVNNCIIEVFRTVNDTNQPSPGDSLTISIVRFESKEQALLLYNSALASALITAEQIGDIAVIQQGLIGNDSYLMDVKSGGVGAIAVYVQETAFISMSSTADSEGKALLDAGSLTAAALLVQARIP